MEEGENSLDAETTCPTCDAEFLDAEDLVVHIKQVHWTASCRCCDFCPFVFRCLDDYALHIINTHLLCLKACQFCYRVYNDFDLLRKHENKHPNHRREGTFSCSQCSKVFHNIPDLAEHEFKEHNDGQEGVFFNEVFPLLSAKLNIKALTFIMSLKERVAYFCPCCLFTSHDPGQYISHLSRKRCNSMVCSKCSNVYRGKKGLLIHLKRHKECFLDPKLEDLSKKCKKCEKNVSLKSYKDHLKTCKPIKCLVCNLIMPSMYALSKHQSEHHPMTIQMKTCRFCRREFVGSVALQRHFNRLHTKEVYLYKYRCVYCEDMYFKHPQKLFAHLYTKHQDITPFSCMLCNKTFRMRKTFTIHIKVVHNSVGHVEFDENYHVFFKENKSDNPFTPTCLFPELVPNEIQDLDHFDNEQTSHAIDATTDAQTDAQTDAPTDVPTDVQTDAEEKSTVISKQPPKIRYKEESSKKLQAANSLSEANKSQAQLGGVVSTPKLKRGNYRKLRENKLKKQMLHEDKGDTDSDDEPLIKKKRAKKSWNNKILDRNKKSLTCNLCKKYCYTLFNYNHHMSLHFKDEVKKCVKCSQEFSSKRALENHMSQEHTSSRLTETLKNLLNRRKLIINGTLPELTPAEKFKKTIKKAHSETLLGSVSIKEVTDKVSVQKFIEEFTPEEKEAKEKSVEIQSSVSIQAVNCRWPRQPTIKMVKFISPPAPTNVKLALPVKFKEVPTERPKITCRVIHKPLTPYLEEQDDHGDDSYHYEEDIEQSQDKNETVPEVAQEIMLETQEQPHKPTPTPIIPHKIVLPKLPENFKKDIKIAHLLAEAPYYKIVNMADVIKQSEETTEPMIDDKCEDEDIVELPAGTKLVNVNPLAHLLGNTSVEEILGSKRKKTYYKPKSANYQNAIAKALLKLEQQQPTKVRNRKKKNVENK